MGGIFGYYIGYWGFDVIGKPIIESYHLWDKIGLIAQKYTESAILALAAAGFTPIPYKLFTIATGFFDAVAGGTVSVPMADLARSFGDDPQAMEKGRTLAETIKGLKPMGLLTFVIVSSLSRSARFFLVGGLIFFFGKKMKTFIDKYFNLLTIIFMVLLVLGFIAIKVLFK